MENFTCTNASVSTFLTPNFKKRFGGLHYLPKVGFHSTISLAGGEIFDSDNWKDILNELQMFVPDQPNEVVDYSVVSGGQLPKEMSFEEF